MIRNKTTFKLVKINIRLVIQNFVVHYKITNFRLLLFFKTCSLHQLVYILSESKKDLVWVWSKTTFQRSKGVPVNMGSERRLKYRL